MKWLLVLIPVWLGLGSGWCLPATDINLAQGYRVAASAGMAGDLDSAERNILKALELAPNDAEVQFICGRIMGRQAGKALFKAYAYARKSLACLQRAVALQPDNYRYHQGLMSFFLGAPAIAGGDRALAWAQVEKISAIDAFQGVLARLEFYHRTDQAGLVAQTLADGITRFSDNAAIHFRSGLHLQSEQRYPEAMAAFASAAEAPIDDENQYRFNAYYQMGRTAVFSGQMAARGIESLRHYLAQAPDANGLPEKAWAHFRLAQLYQLSDQRELIQQHLAQSRLLNDLSLQKEIEKLERVARKTIPM